MKSFSKGQLKTAAEIFGNISVTWFAAGIVAPLFSRSFIWINFLVSLVAATIFFIIALLLVKNIQI
jgi:hypothetical protein